MKEMRSVVLDLLGDEVLPGEQLRTIRVKMGISQEELQEITNIARSNISALENGRLEMTYHYALIFGSALNIHPAKLLFPNGHYSKTDELKKIEKKAESILKKRASGS